MFNAIKAFGVVTGLFGGLFLFGYLGLKFPILYLLAILGVIGWLTWDLKSVLDAKKGA